MNSGSLFPAMVRKLPVLCLEAPGFVPGAFFQLPAVDQSCVCSQLAQVGRGFGKIAVPDVFLHLVPFLTGQGIPLRRHRPVVIVEICRPGLPLFKHDIHQDNAAVVANGPAALREKNLFLLDGQVVQGIAGVHHIEVVVGSLLKHGDHIPAEQIDTDSERFKVVSGHIEGVGGKVASTVLSHLPRVQNLVDMGGVSASQVEDLQLTLAFREQRFDGGRDLLVEHEVVADDLLVGAPGFPEDVDRVCVHIENELPFDVNPLILWHLLALPVPLRACETMVQPGSTVK